MIALQTQLLVANILKTTAIDRETRIRHLVRKTFDPSGNRDNGEMTKRDDLTIIWL